ncbi:response regulator [Chitinophaga pendula]|uniref:response regulator n=1 Tax=Chitinophaga TaxID=79328 RepID=UPI000BAECFAB|nr:MULTISPECIES: response regulator [Chitinophaga]ASZ12691.1 response regulator [Chitinophaga sp. MD30]UCJ09697.1 response regulator [Chitinophaga pendula]
MKETTQCLLIDDDKDDQEIFLLALEGTGLKLHCRVVASATAALELLEQERTLPDIIFLDMNMPRMSGKEFLVMIKQYSKLSHIPIVMCSTSADEKEVRECRSLGAADYIIKSPSLTHFRNILAQCLRQLMHSTS